MKEERDLLKSKFPELEKYSAKLERAVDAVMSGSVKEALFTPSGRKVITVVGRLGDEFIDPDKPYCSCSNFFFRVMGGREDTCYHLLGYTVASKTGRVDVTEFVDEEYESYLSATVRDVFEVLRRSSS
ncbi:MAG: hypothetical protein JRN12_02740 [Nitrososphaerota archaeon]|nr:hypothetical protein [Nitrososphaerota archaeon]MDG6943027.1 hypothetical protein [Nitrososphaerota archaeon]MDG6950756.1 hypothetical protein [Nitrososphaerota archaeon]